MEIIMSQKMDFDAIVIGGGFGGLYAVQGPPIVPPGLHKNSAADSKSIRIINI